MGYVMQQCGDNEAEAEEVPRAAGGCQGGRVREAWQVLQGGLLMMQLHGYELIAAQKNDENNRKFHSRKPLLSRLPTSCR